MSELQGIVDSLGSRLKRAVAIDDPRMHLQAYNSHYGKVDPVRLASILHREAPPEAVKWVLSLGIANAKEPVKVPANPKLKMEARVCVPIRAQSYLLGYLWLIDADSSLNGEELDIAVAAATEAGIVMYREQLLRELERGRERELLRDLLSDDQDVRIQAAGQLVESDLFLAATPITVLVARPVLDEGSPDDGMRMSIEVVLDRVRRSLAPRHGLFLARQDHGILVVAAGDARFRGQLRMNLANDLQAKMQKIIGTSVLVGVGDVHESLSETLDSYRQAQEAVRVAQIVPSYGTVVEWSQLGIYRMLSRFPIERLTSDALHPGLVKLLERKDSQPLLQTLECYLDRGCDAKSTSAELNLHRASLYYRLQKIEEIAGVRLKDGEDRLALHLGLKLARLAGIRD